MAREFGKVLTSAHDDPEMRQLEPLEQWCYHYVLDGRKDINNAGVLGYNPRAWAKVSKGATEQLIVELVASLANAGYVVLDEDTDELLVRSFMRGDGIAKQPNIMISASKHAMQVASPTIRAALARELRRIAADPRYAKTHRSSVAVHQAVAALDPDGPPPPPVIAPDVDAEEGSAKGSPNGSNGGARKGSAKGSGKPAERSIRAARTGVQEPLPIARPAHTRLAQAEDFDEGFGEGLPEPTGVGEGIGEGGSPSVGGHFSRKSSSRAREHDDPSDLAAELVTRALPADIGPTTGTHQQLATRVADRLAAGISPPTAEAALHRWATTDDVGPGAINYMIDDALKDGGTHHRARTAPRPGLEAKVAGWAEVAAEVADEPHQHPPSNVTALPPGATS